MNTSRRGRPACVKLRPMAAPLLSIAEARERVLHAEAHPHALAACTIVPAGLGERVGDYAGLAIAQQVFNQQTS